MARRSAQPETALATTTAPSDVAFPAELMITDDERAKLATLDMVSSRCSLQALASISSQAERSIMLAKAMKLALESLEPFRAHIESLRGSPIGYILDKPEEYDWGTLKTVIAEGLLKGARLTGNEINGIGKRCYLTQAYYVRKVREWPGLTVTRETLQVPRQLQGQTVVDARIDYELNGQADHYTRDGNNAIPIRVNNGMGPDAILGKARRKAYAGLMDNLISRSGLHWTPGNDGEVDAAAAPEGATPAQQPQVGHQSARPQQPRRFDVPAWTQRIAEATNPTLLAGLGRTLTEQGGLRDGIWSDDDAVDFLYILKEYVKARLGRCTNAADVQAVKAIVEAIARVRSGPNFTDSYSVMIALCAERLQAINQPTQNPA